jgi:hypothetical protein
MAIDVLAISDVDATGEEEEEELINESKLGAA